MPSAKLDQGPRVGPGGDLAGDGFHLRRVRLEARDRVVLGAGQQLRDHAARRLDPVGIG
jgi:hypothetical protein